MTDQKPIEKLKEAIQEFINSKNEEPRVLLSAVVTWEVLHYDDDGDETYGVDFACVGGTSLATAIGLYDFGKAMMTDQVLRGDISEEDY